MKLSMVGDWPKENKELKLSENKLSRIAEKLKTAVYVCVT